ncbi:MAG: hypothetical protein IMW86_05600 [Hydrogenibacillus sp.]|nr:hypothetical protein [Hydrogenibacillus sp.]
MIIIDLRRFCALLFGIALFVTLFLFFYMAIDRLHDRWMPRVQRTPHAGTVEVGRPAREGTSADERTSADGRPRMAHPALGETDAPSLGERYYRFWYDGE